MAAAFLSAIGRMRSPRDMHIICVDVTNRCDLRCSNCTRLLVNQKHHWDMTPDNFRTALRSLAGFPGVIAMIGGNPCLHRDFAGLCAIFREEVADPRQRGLWSNNVFDHQELIRDTFGFFNLNPHGDERCEASLRRLAEVIPGLPFYQGHSRHAPLLAAVRDVALDEGQMWDLIAECDINRNWSASIVENQGQLRAYFCEVAASFDLARGTDHGHEVTEGWWRQSVEAFADQVGHFCPGCGVPARLEAREDSDETDDYTESNADIALATRGKRKTARTWNWGPLRRVDRPVTDYSEHHGAQAGVAVSVVIPCYNAAETIEETVASVLAQRGPGLEVDLIIVDDASTDDGPAKVNALAAAGPSLRLARMAANSGPAAARNAGLRLARGDLVCFLDADDCYAPGFFAAALPLFAANPTMGALVTNLELVNCHREIDAVRLGAVVSSLPSNVMVRRSVAELVGGFPEDAAFRGPGAGEDATFRQALNCYFQVGFLDTPYLRYRIRRGSHFDRFLDATEVIDGTLRFNRVEQEDADGSRPAATLAYFQAIERRLGATRMLRAA